MKKQVVLTAVLALSILPGLAFAQCGQQGPDSGDGADMIVVEGALELGSMITLQMTIDGEVVEIVEAGWWEGRANSRELEWHGVDPNEDGSITFELEADLFNGLGEGTGYIEATNPGESHWIYYNIDELCFAGSTGPNLSLIVEGATYAEQGGDITMTANEDMIAGGSLVWYKGNSIIPGETNATFSLISTVVGDSGSYTLWFDDGEGKATAISNAVEVSIFPPNTLPVSGLIGLGLLAVVGSLGGVVALRKKS